MIATDASTIAICSKASVALEPVAPQAARELRRRGATSSAALAQDHPQCLGTPLELV